MFSLQQALKMYDAVQERIAAYEQEILRQLGEMEEPGQGEETAPPLSNANKAKAIKTRGQEVRQQALYRMSGVDITQIDAIGVETVEVVLSEYGPDLSRFPQISHMTHVCPTNARGQVLQGEAPGGEHLCAEIGMMRRQEPIETL